jgi:hypothetical protein
MAIAADAIGYLALAVMVLGLVRKDSKHLLLMIAGGVFLWGVHYGMLGSTSGAIVHGIAGVGVFLAHATYSARLSHRVLLAGCFSVIGVIASLYTDINPANVAAAVGCVVMTTSQYVLRDAQMRQGFLAGEAAFFVFAAIVGSVPGMLVTIVNALAGLIGMFRLHRQSLAQPQVQL